MDRAHPAQARSVAGERAQHDVQSSYDRIAREYADRIYDELRHKPLDCELLDRFAQRVKACGEVCDMGCGPAHVARYLHDRGASVFGLDLSPGMLDEARRLNPGIAFRHGDMMALDLPDSSLAGITASYSIVHFSTEMLPRVFREMHRVLQPGGWLLLGFHTTPEADLSEAERLRVMQRGVQHLDELWGQKVSMDFMFFQPQTVAKELESAGFQVEEIIERDPYPEVEVQTKRAYIFAYK